jgi:hypothetical protein
MMWNDVEHNELARNMVDIKVRKLPAVNHGKRLVGSFH